MLCRDYEFSLGIVNVYSKIKLDIVKIECAVYLL